MARFREACSVVLTRGAFPDPEVYVVLRAPALRFFGGCWAFPGGVLDREDGPAQDPRSRRRCALRELFEETGVLGPAMGGHLEVTERDALRRGLLEGEESARRRWVELAAATPSALDELHWLGRLTTPEFAPVRYRTDFFALPLPADQVPEVVPGELVEGCFAASDEISGWFRRGERPVVPPVLFLLDQMRGRDLEGFRDALSRELQRLADGAFHSVRFSPGVFTVPLRTRTLPPATTTNCHLVGESRVYVVDPAPTLEEEQRRLVDHLRSIQAQGREVVGVVLSHHHADHVGAARVVAAELGIPVFAHPETLRRLELDDLPQRELHGGELLELGTAPDGSEGWALECLHTPGHAPGHLAFVDRRYRTFLAGDLVSTLSTIVIDPEDGHLATYLQSLRRCLERPLGVCLPAHGPAHQDSHAVIGQLLEHRRKREERVVAALRPEVRTLEELVAVAYEDVAPEVREIALRSLESGLIKLAEEGRAEEVEAGWRSVGT